MNDDRTISRFHYGWMILAAGTLVVFAALGLARFGYTLVLPAMQEGLNMDNTEAGVLATSNLVGYLVLSVLGGALASRVGPRIVIAAGLALAGLSMVATGLVGTYPVAAFWRCVTGVGSGASNVPVMGLMAAWFSARRRGLAMGIASGGSSIALILLGPIVPSILNTFGDNGWRVCWMLFGGTTLLLAAGAWLILRNNPAELGLRPVGAVGDIPPVRPGPMRWSSVYRSPTVWHLGLVYVAFGFSYIIYITFFFKYLTAEGGWSREAAGGLFMTIGWLSLFCGLLWGTVSDYIGRKWALVLVYGIQAVAYLLFAHDGGTTAHVVSAVLFGVTAWSIPAIMAAACGDTLGPRLAPAALGFITLFFGIGQALGPGIAGAVADATGSFGAAFALSAVVAALGAVGAAFMKSGAPAVDEE